MTVLLAFQRPQRYPVLNITSKFHDQLPQKLPTITNAATAGKFDRGEKHSC